MPASGPRSRGARAHPPPHQGCLALARRSAASGLVLATQNLGGITGRGTKEVIARRMEVEAAAVAALRRNAVFKARPAAQLVLDELLPHQPSRGVRREAEPLPDLDAALQPVALGRALVRDTAEVPRLMGEDGEGAGRLVRSPLTLERQPVEIVAALRRQVGEVSRRRGQRRPRAGRRRRSRRTRHTGS